MENGSAATEATEESSVAEVIATGNLVRADSGKAIGVDREEEPAPLSPVARKEMEEDCISDAVDGSLRAKRKLKKRVSFVSEPSQEMRIISARDCLLKMQAGCELVKVRQRGHYTRFFTLDEDLSGFQWKPSNKKNGKARVSVLQIHEVRRGRNTEFLRNFDSAMCEDQMFSVIYGEDYKTMDLLADSTEMANVWVTGLLHLINQRNRDLEEGKVDIRTQWLQDKFEEADMNSDGFLDEDEVVSLCRNLNIGLPEPAIRQKFLEAHKTQLAQFAGHLSPDEFSTFFSSLSTRQEIYFLVAQFGNGEYLTASQLLAFLQSEQKLDSLSLDDCEKFIETFEPSSLGKKNKHLTIDGFTFFLKSSHSLIFNPDHLVVNQDMSQPLSHYFIASSHNTFLTQDQQGPVSDTVYARTLQRGCRCIEVDVWDGEEDEPVVRQGMMIGDRTVLLKDVLRVIADNAFSATPYPLIIRLENHCFVDCQQKIVEYVQNYIGGLLADETVFPDSCLPSPEQLRNKIIILSKKLTEEEEEKGNGEVSEEEDNEHELKSPSSADSYGRKRFLSGQSLPSESPERTSPVMSRLSLCAKLSSLIRLHSKMFNGLSSFSAKPSGPCRNVCSMSEAHLMVLSAQLSDVSLQHTKHNLVRVFPAVTRADSSNYSPMDAWVNGVQIASLNYQTIGKPMDINEGMFKRNGQCGYVLKPAIMREGSGYFQANTRSSLPGITPVELSVKVISGQQLPKPAGAVNRSEVIDPYVKVEIVGLPCDCAVERTKSVANNGFNPVWDEMFTFRVRFPELALLHFEVLDLDAIGHDFIGQYTVPILSLQQGYRHVPLISSSHLYMPNVSLFAHITVNKDRLGRRGSILGQKPSKKMKKEVMALRVVGLKDLDAYIKKFSSLVSQAVEVSFDAEIAFDNIKDVCGLSYRSSLKDCFRLLATRAKLTSVKCSMVCDEQSCPTFSVVGENPPELIKRCFSAIQQGVPAWKALLTQSPQLIKEMAEAHVDIMRQWDGLADTLSQNGLSGKRLSKSLEAFSWNVRTLQSQAEELETICGEVRMSLKQITEAAREHGLVNG